MAEDNQLLHYTLPNGDTFSAPVNLSGVTIRKELAEAGYDPEHIEKALQKPMSHPEWIGKQIASPFKAIGAGLAKAPGALADMFNPTTQTGVEPDLRKTGGVPPEEMPQQPDTSFSGAIGEAIGYKPQSKLDEYLQTGAEGVGQAALAPGKLAAKALVYGALPAVSGKGAREATEGVKIPDWVPFAGGKDISPAAGFMASLFSPTAARKIITPNTITDPSRLTAAKTLEKEGITPTAGQLTEKESLLNAERRAKPKISEEQAKDWTKAVTRKAGQEVKSLTPGEGGTLASIRKNAKQEMENVSQQFTIPVTPQVINGLRAVSTANPQHTPKIQSLVYDTLGRNTIFKNNQLSGEDYQHLVSRLRSEASSASPGYANALNNVAKTLDAALPPGGREAFDAARNQYKNMLTLRAARSRTGATDQPTPQEIERAGKRVVGKEKYTEGGSDYQPLTEAAQKVLKPHPEYAKPTPGHLGATLGTILGGGGTQAALYHMGVPFHDAATPAILASILGGAAGELTLGRKALAPITKALQPAQDAWTMSRANQAYQKNQFAPLLPQEREQRYMSMILRGIMEKQNQDKQ